MSNTHDIKAAIEAGIAQVDVNKRIGVVNGIPIAMIGDGGITKIVVLKDVLQAQCDQADHPAAKHGTATLHDLDSFIAHIQRNKTKTSTLWANILTGSIDAIYDFHGESGKPAEWGRHRAVYVMPKSPEWVAWKKHADDWMTQEEFSELLESRMDDLVDGGGLPAPVELLEVARNLQIHTKGQFLKKIHPETGQYTLICKEEHTEDSTKIPGGFFPAVGGAPRSVRVRDRAIIIRHADARSCSRGSSRGDCTMMGHPARRAKGVRRW